MTFKAEWNTPLVFGQPEVRNVVIPALGGRSCPVMLGGGCYTFGPNNENGWNGNA